MLFYSLNSQNSEIENTGILREQADSDFSKSDKANWPLSQKNGFAANPFILISLLQIT